MKLSAPIYVLKSKAKALKKEHSISMNEALNQIAQKEGFNSWSLLQSKSEDFLPKRYDEVLSFFNPGDLVVIASRPGYGKTSFTLGLFVQAIKEKRVKNYYFTLAETHKDVAGRIALYDPSIGEDDSIFKLNYSNDISADYIIDTIGEEINPTAVIVIDYLQLLDEKRTNPPVQSQIEKLKDFAKEKKCIILFLSQVQREIELRNDQTPTMKDLRLPNPLDTKLFNKGIFLHRKTKESEDVDVTLDCGSIHKLQVKWNHDNAMFFDLKR